MPKAEDKYFKFKGEEEINPNFLETFPFDSPNQYIMTLKSLKYYFVSFRNVGIYQEGATKRIYNDLKSALDTEKIQITTVYNTRGGFNTTCIEGVID